MKKLFSTLTAILMALISVVPSVAYDGLVPNTGESMQKVYILVGLMAVALIAIIVLIILRVRNNKNDKNNP